MKALWKEYWKVILEKKWSFIALIIIIAIVNMLEVLIPTYYKELANLFGVSATPQGIDAIWHSFLGIALCYMGLWFFWRVFDFFFIIPHQLGGMRSLMQSSFWELQSKQYKFFQNNFVGSLVSKAGKFVFSFENISDWFLFNFWNTLTLIIFTFVAFKSQDTTFAYIFIVWVICFLVMTTLFSIIGYRYNSIAANADSRMKGIFSDTFSNIFTVKSAALEQKEFSIFDECTLDIYRKKRIAWVVQFAMFSTQGLFTFGIELYLLSSMITQWEMGVFNVGQFVLFQSLILFLIHRIWEFGRGMRNLFGAIADASEMAEIMQNTNIEQDSENAKHYNIQKGEIEFRNMEFGYEEAIDNSKTDNVGVQHLEPEGHDDLDDASRPENSQEGNKVLCPYGKINYSPISI